MPDRGVPVEVVEAGRRPIAAYFETQGSLEAENEVDLVARTAGPITELLAEEGMRVKKGQLLARIDDRELRAQLEVARVSLDETQKAYERVKTLHDSQLVSQEALDQALASYQSAQADFDRTEIQLDYTRITAPFSGQIVERYIKLAEHVANNANLFRLTDFDPLLCPIQVPERQLADLAKGQPAELEVEAYPGERFTARVLRVSPVVESDTGTVRVTLEVSGQGKLRPGMFASVFLEMERHENALVIPKTALALDSLGDTVFVAGEEAAERRSIDIGLRNDTFLEVRSGLTDGEQVVVIGQDGLSEGTPVEVLAVQALPGANGPEGLDGSPPDTRPSQDARVAQGPRAGAGDGDGRRGRGGDGPFGGGGGPFANIDLDNPEDVQRVRGFMKQRGLSDDEIDQRLERMRERMKSRGNG